MRHERLVMGGEACPGSETTRWSKMDGEDKDVGPMPPLNPKITVIINARLSPPNLHIAHTAMDPHPLLLALFPKTTLVPVHL
jgi:hypothetical protein